MRKIDSRKFRKPMPCFLMNKSVPNTTGSVTTARKVHRSAASVVAVSTSTSKTSSVGTFSRRFLAAVHGAAQPVVDRDILIRHTVSLRDVYLGTEQEVVVDLPEPCGTCDGTGAKDGKLKTCSTCGGQGQVRVRQQVGPFIQEAVQTCQDCGGRGQVAEQPCPDCSRSWSKTQIEQATFTVPEGAEDGTRMRMRGKENLLHKAWVNPVICSLNLRLRSTFGLSGPVRI